MRRIDEDGGNCFSACRFTVHLWTPGKVSKISFNNDIMVTPNTYGDILQNFWVNGYLGAFSFCYMLDIQDGRQGSLLNSSLVTSV